MKRLIGLISLIVILLTDGLVQEGLAGTGALSFNGSNQYVTFGAAPSLGVTNFTIECWFKRTGTGATTTTGTGGITTAIPLVSKGRGEAENSNLDMNWFQWHPRSWKV